VRRDALTVNNGQAFGVEQDGEERLDGDESRGIFARMEALDDSGAVGKCEDGMTNSPFNYLLHQY
jgi:hypothetical protein